MALLAVSKQNDLARYLSLSPRHAYYPIVGAILLLSAVQMFRSTKNKSTAHSSPPVYPPLIPALLTGAVIGFISGTTGTGGGIFLAPVILSMN